jgi:predicted DNA binding CopG/RHH family protein
MAKTAPIPSSDEAWDTGKLGRHDDFARKVELNENEIDAALELQLISIRLPKSLIEDFKMIAQFNNMGYQPLMRQILKRFADGEKRQILQDYVAAQVAERKKTATDNKKTETVVPRRKVA